MEISDAYQWLIANFNKDDEDLDYGYDSGEDEDIDIRVYKFSEIFAQLFGFQAGSFSFPSSGSGCSNPNCTNCGGARARESFYWRSSPEYPKPKPEHESDCKCDKCERKRARIREREQVSILS